MPSCPISTLTQRTEACSHILRERLRVLPRREVASTRVILVVRQIWIGFFGPLSRDWGELIREVAHHDRDGDLLRIEEGKRAVRVEAFPVQVSGRYSGAGQPVEGDIVENVVSRQTFFGTIEDASD